MKHFITEIQIQQLLHLTNLKISLSSSNRQNLILTGKNGSGKTTLLLALEGFLSYLSWWDGAALDDHYFWMDMQDTAGITIEQHETDRKRQYYRVLSYFAALRGINIVMSTTAGMKSLLEQGKFIIAYYPAERRSLFDTVSGVEDVQLKSCYGMEENPGALLLKYMVHLKTQQAYARNAGDEEVVELIRKWFERFEDALGVLLEGKDIRLEYDYREYCFWIVESPQKKYTFSQLSDGYSAILRIVTDLMLRMDQSWLKTGTLSCYDVEGIALIDELETHLHIDLQRKILPFLTTFFPEIQFVVSTHSPYILSSISNALVYDMEKNIAVEDMSAYSAESIVEGYFEEQVYSEEIRGKILRYEELAFLREPSEEERAERAELRAELRGLSGQLSGEAKAAFEEIEDRRKRNG
ncbi:MAG: ATP-binding protein [Acetatifactor muris]|nr:ATP-binding protein [Acetatifactor muris]